MRSYAIYSYMSFRKVLNALADMAVDCQAFRDLHGARYNCGLRGARSGIAMD